MNRKLLIEEIDIQISEFKNILKSENNHDILEEKILTLLGDIEEKVFQIVGNKNNSTPIQKEIILQRFAAMYIIDTQYTSIDDFLDELIDKLYQEVENRKILLTHDLFTPGTSSIESSSTINKKVKLQTSAKNKILQRVLYKLGFNSSDIDVFGEKLASDRMRKIPYNIFHINKSGIQRTIFVCDEIGQATFVYEGIIDTNIFQNIEKGEIIGNSQALKIIYSKKTFENNLEISLSDKLTFAEKEEKIENEEEEKADIEKKEKITQDELFKIMHSYEGRTTQESYDYFMNLKSRSENKKDTIPGLQIKGNHVTGLKTISGIKIDGNIYHPSIFQKWIQEIFKGKDIILQNQKILGKQELFKLMHTYKGSPQESYDFFISLQHNSKYSNNSIVGLKIKGYGAFSLKTISGIKIEGDIFTIPVFQKWIQEIFKGQDVVFNNIEETTKETLLQSLHTYKGTPQKSFDYFMGMRSGSTGDENSILGFKINGHAVVQLKIISESTIVGNMQRIAIFQKWIKEMFEGQDVVFKESDKITKEELPQLLHSYKGLPQKSYDFFMKLEPYGGNNCDSIRGLKIKGCGMARLKTISGSEIKGGIRTLSVFQKWIKEMFKGQDIILKKNKDIQ